MIQTIGLPFVIVSLLILLRLVIVAEKKNKLEGIWSVTLDEFFGIE